ncbi:hypothetical protein H0H93_001518 [Arthromyces matolae]|nr:hypothetical protein H0H93_001518 [Arthromyces matolae]
MPKTSSTTSTGKRPAQAAAAEAAKRKEKQVATTREKRGQKAKPTANGHEGRDNIENTHTSGAPSDTSPPAHSTTGVLRDTVNMENIAAQMADLQAKLAESQAANNKLQEELNASTPAKKTSIDKRSTTIKMIPRPDGTAGHHFSIQEEMGLSGSAKKIGEYKALVRFIHQMTMQSRMNWEMPWTKIAPRDKANLFDVCRKEQPILARFVNDWATEEIVKQYMKNKRTYAYKKGYLDRPPGYEHLKVNASKRSNAPRRKKASRVVDSDMEEEDLDADTVTGSNGDGRDEDDDEMVGAE